MRYFKAKIVQKEGTTLDFVTPLLMGAKLEEETNCTCVNYLVEDGYSYWGVSYPAIPEQYPECEVTELTFEQMQPVLQGCRTEKEIDEIRIKTNDKIGDKLEKDFGLEK